MAKKVESSKSTKKRTTSEKKEILGVAKEVVDVYEGKTLGTTTILSSMKMKLNGREVFKLKLADGTQMILSEKDLEKQAK